MSTKPITTINQIVFYEKQFTPEQAEKAKEVTKKTAEYFKNMPRLEFALYTYVPIFACTFFGSVTGATIGGLAGGGLRTCRYQAVWGCAEDLGGNGGAEPDPGNLRTGWYRETRRRLENRFWQLIHRLA